MTTLSPRFEWPPDVEAAIYDHIRPHVQCGLKRRTWHAIHAELMKTVPRHEDRLPRVFRAIFDILGEAHGQFFLAWMSHSLVGVGALRGGEDHRV